MYGVRNDEERSLNPTEVYIRPLPGNARCHEFFEVTGLLVLTNIIPVEILPVHGNIHSRAQNLYIGQRGTQIEKTI